MSGGWRALAVVLALALAFAGAVMIVAMIDIADTPLRDECERENIQAGEIVCDEHFKGSSEQKTASIVLGWPSGVLAGIAALLALYFAVTGRQGRLLIQLTVAAIFLGGISILVGSV